MRAISGAVHSGCSGGNNRSELSKCYANSNSSISINKHFYLIFCICAQKLIPMQIAIFFKAFLFATRSFLNLFVYNICSENKLKIPCLRSQRPPGVATVCGPAVVSERNMPTLYQPLACRSSSGNKYGTSL